MASIAIDVAFPLKLHDGTEHDVTGRASVMYEVVPAQDDSPPLVNMLGVVLTHAVVDGLPLRGWQLYEFEKKYRVYYKEAIEWIAFSSIDLDGVLSSSP